MMPVEKLRGEAELTSDTNDQHEILLAFCGSFLTRTHLQ